MKWFYGSVVGATKYTVDTVEESALTKQFKWPPGSQGQISTLPMDKCNNNTGVVTQTEDRYGQYHV